MSPMVKLPLTLEHALLGFLWQRPMYAYEMYQTFKQAHELGLVWRLKQSQLYALLTRLEDAGFITTVTEPQGPRPPRKMMYLTTAGRDAYRDWLQAAVAHGRDFRQEFLAKLYFAREDDPTTVATLVERQRRAAEGWLAEIDAQTAAAATGSYEWLVLQFRAGQVRAILAWLDTSVTALAEPLPA